MPTDFNIYGDYYAPRGDNLELRLGDTPRVCHLTYEPKVGDSVDININNSMTSQLQGDAVSFDFVSVCYPALDACLPYTIPLGDSVDININSNYSYTGDSVNLSLGCGSLGGNTKGDPDTEVLESLAWLGKRVPWKNTYPLDKTYSDYYYVEPPKQEVLVALPYYTDIPEKDYSLGIGWTRFDIIDKESNYSYSTTLPKKDTKYMGVWGGFIIQDFATKSGWLQTIPSQDLSILIQYSYPSIIDLKLGSPWGDFEYTDTSLGLGYVGYAPNDIHKSILWDESYLPQKCGKFFIPTSGDTLDFNIDLSTSEYSNGTNPINLAIGELSNMNLACYAKEEGGNKDAYVDYPAPTSYPEPPLEIQQVYYIMNQVSVTVGGTELHISQLKLSIDTSSWSWRFSATLVDKTQFPLVNPAVLGSPSELMVTINGYVWKILTNNFNRSREFIGESATLSGNSLSLELAPPIFEKTSLIQTTTLTANQLADQELTNTGWTLSWGVPDWSVDGDTWSYNDKTPVEAIADIASAVGGFVTPHKENKVLYVKPMYKNHYWDMGAVTPDVTISSSMADGESVAWRPQTTYNSVSIGGVNSGVIVNGKITGTDGLTKAASKTHKLITQVAVGQEACRNELASYGNKKDYQYSLPLYAFPANPQLSECGDIIEVQDPSVGNWLGWVKLVGVSVTINNRAIKVRQSINIERHIA